VENHLGEKKNTGLVRSERGRGQPSTDEREKEFARNTPPSQRKSRRMERDPTPSKKATRRILDGQDTSSIPYYQSSHRNLSGRMFQIGCSEEKKKGGVSSHTLTKIPLEGESLPRESNERKRMNPSGKTQLQLKTSGII